MSLKIDPERLTLIIYFTLLSASFAVLLLDTPKSIAHTFALLYVIVGFIIPIISANVMPKIKSYFEGTID